MRGGVLLNIMMLLVLVAACAHPASASQVDAMPQDTFEIRLVNRSFTPDPGLDQELTERLATRGDLPTYAVLQLWRLPDGPDRNRLANGGVALKEYLGGRAYLAMLSPDVALAEVAEMMRWAGVVTAQDKIERELWEGHIHDWARTKTGTVRVLVQFHPYVDEDRARQTLQRYEATEVRLHSPPATWAAELSPNALRTLGAVGLVRWIEQGPHPAMPLMGRQIDQ